jgi:hypothetical protein
MDRSQSLGTRTIQMNLYSTTGPKMTLLNSSKKDQISISKSMELTEGLRAQWREYIGFIRFVDTRYVVLQLDSDNPDPQRSVGLCIFQEHWNEIIIQGEN